MLGSGADIAVVSKLLGHGSIAITSDLFGHVIGTVASEAVNGAANLIAHTVHTAGSGRPSCGPHSRRLEALRPGQMDVALAWRNWQRTCLVNRWLGVRVPPPALEKA